MAGEGCESVQTQLALHLVLMFYEEQGYNILLLGLSSQDGGKLSLSETWDFKLFLHLETPHSIWKHLEGDAEVIFTLKNSSVSQRG